MKYIALRKTTREVFTSRTALGIALFLWGKNVKHYALYKRVLCNDIELSAIESTLRNS